MNARFAVMEILIEWEKTLLPIDRLKDQWLQQNPQIDSRDKNLIMAILYGVIRWRLYLDQVLSKFSKYPLNKMKPRTLQALRVGLYQLIFMDRIPAAAAMNETIKALKSAGQPKWLTGFVNGLLRNISRNREGIPSPTEATDIMPDHVRISHPEWLFKRWLKRYGLAKTMEICETNNLLPDLCLRINTDQMQVDQYLAQLNTLGIYAERGRYAPHAVIVQDYKGTITGLPGFKDGHFQVQDEAAQLVVSLLGPVEKGKYLDGCAGLGGKTLQLAQILPPGSELILIEPSETRAQLLLENLHRFDLMAGVRVLPMDIQDALPQYKESFRGVLVDAPCSGLGVIRRHPDIRWNRKEDGLARFQEKQKEILAAAAAMTIPGGVVVYAVCSGEPEEGEEVVNDFLANHQAFSLSDCKKVLPDSARNLTDLRGCLTTFPDPKELDGFYAARLLKKS
ncbi:MAG: 16S rRNA (cytosine(967)-C(5))-methyltransferase RsmB [Proteobacteria bacterium]|nr:16S rRNA (cytosine(967)-C(5))-methyltransferase RsmB [Pseudomonadota bacterium]MBU1711197.1 16S rRNA (cytosine(967)-C(5))-methyltransferase RsmB [Pseudomonadota bacterium]